MAKKYLVKSNIFGVITYKDKSISSFIIVDKIDNELRALADKKLVIIEDLIEQQPTKKNETPEFEEVEDTNNKKRKSRRQ